MADLFAKNLIKWKVKTLVFSVIKLSKNGELIFLSRLWTTMKHNLGRSYFKNEIDLFEWTENCWVSISGNTSQTSSLALQTLLQLYLYFFRQTNSLPYYYYLLMENSIAPTASSLQVQPLSSKNVGTLFNSVEAFLFDCDGVIWKGDKLIEGVTETLEMLRSKGKKLVFVTNNSSKSRKQYAKKFRSLGVPVNEEEIFSSSFAAAMYLKVNKFPQDKKIYVIGQEGILEELELAGFQSLGGPEDGKKSVEPKSNCHFEYDKNVGAVVVGIDHYINYYKLHYATLCIRENPGCLFIATNRDATGPMSDSQEWPGAGCMVGAVCGSTQKEPIVVGKPATFMMDFLLQNEMGWLKFVALGIQDFMGLSPVLEQFLDSQNFYDGTAQAAMLKHINEIQFQIDTSKMCMVGDRLDTDILFGKNAGCKTLLVLSGITSLSALQDPSNNIKPDYYASKVADILKFLEE
ncbi:hypothetical protein C5167_026128 [Papaver somniferum]|nr:hypothetical protein C5167_026128 [Papaver somniferum]